MLKAIWIGYVSSLVATALWAGNFVVARALAFAIPPFQFNFWRWVVAFAVILPFALPGLKDDWPGVRAHIRYLSLMALIGVTMMNVFIYKAGQTTESLNMALIMPATPAVIIILARIFYSEPIGWRKIAGVVTASCGIVVLVSRGSWARLSALEFQEGDLWTLGCMGCFALYSLLMRQRPREISSAGFNAVVFGLGILFALPMTLAEAAFFSLPKLSWPVAWGVLYAGIGSSALAFWFWTVGVDRIGPVKAGLVYYTVPFFAAIMAKIVLDENVVAAQLWGGCLIIGGIICATLPAHFRR